MKRLIGSIRRLTGLAGFFLFFIKELVLANLRVAHDVISVHPRMRPGIIAVPLDLERDISLFVLANLLTMTPGTLSLDVSTDCRVLYIHVLYLEDDPEKNKTRIKQTFEKKIKRLLEND